MSRFLDQLERISQNTPTPLGFGVSRPARTPGMALVALVSGSHGEGCAAVAELAPDGAILSGVEGPGALESLKDSVPTAPWGVRSDSLTGDDVKAYQEAGCDVLVFGLEGTRASAVSSDALARVLCVEPDLSTGQLRGIDSLPVDVLLVDMAEHSGPWTLADIARVAGVSRRVDKYVLLNVAQPPEKADLEAIRDVAQVHGVTVTVLIQPFIRERPTADVLRTICDYYSSGTFRRCGVNWYEAAEKYVDLITSVRLEVE